MKNDKKLLKNISVVKKNQGRHFTGSMQNFAQRFYEEFIQAERVKDKAIMLVKHN